MAGPAPTPTLSAGEAAAVNSYLASVASPTPVVAGAPGTTAQAVTTGAAAVPATQLGVIRERSVGDLRIAKLYTEGVEEEKDFQPFDPLKMKLMEAFANSEGETETTIDGRTYKLDFVDRTDNGVEPKCVYFVKGGVEQKVNLDYFNYDPKNPYALLPIFNDGLSRLEAPGKGNVISNPRKKISAAQRTMHNNGFYAWKREPPPQYALIFDDSKFGRQSGQGEAYGIQAGELMLEFGLVNSWYQYRTIYNEALPVTADNQVAQPSKRFQKRLLILKQFMNNNQRVRNLVLGGAALTEPTIGNIKGNTGKYISKLYDEYVAKHIGKPDLKNIASQRLIMIKSRISASDTQPPFTRLPAVIEAKMAMFSLYKDGERIYKREKIDGMWDTDFEDALVRATGRNVINQESAGKLLQMCDQSLNAIKGMLENDDSLLRKFPNLITEKQIGKWKLDFDRFYNLTDDKMSKAERLYNINEIVVENFMGALKAALFARLSMRLDDTKASVYGNSTETGAIPSLQSNEIDDMGKLQKLLAALLKIPALAKRRTTILTDADAQAGLKKTLTDVKIDYDELSKARDNIVASLSEFVAAQPSISRMEGMADVFLNMKNEFDPYVRDLIAAIRIKIGSLQQESDENRTTYWMKTGYCRRMVIGDDPVLVQWYRTQANGLDKVMVPKAVMTSNQAEIDNILASPQYKFFLALDNIRKHENENKEILEAARDLFDTRMRNIAANRAKYLLPYHFKTINFMSFKENLYLACLGGRLNPAGETVLQAYMIKKHIDFAEGQLENGLIRGVIKDRDPRKDVLLQFIREYMP